MKKKYLITKDIKNNKTNLCVHLYNKGQEPDILKDCLYIDYDLGLPEVAIIIGFKDGEENLEELENIIENEFGILYYPHLDDDKAVILSSMLTYPIILNDFSQYDIRSFNEFIQNQVFTRVDKESDYFSKWKFGSEDNVDEKVYYFGLEDNKYTIHKKHVCTEIFDSCFTIDDSIDDEFLKNSLEVKLYSNHKAKLSGIKNLTGINISRNKEGIMIENRGKRYFFFYKSEYPAIVEDEIKDKTKEYVERYISDLADEMALIEKGMRTGWLYGSRYDQ